eukprot:824080-Pyramimonas_sp.AAC.1
MRGRGQGYRIEERRMKSTLGRAHLLDPVLEGWQTLSTLLARLVALLTNGPDRPQQRECVARAIPLLRARVWKNDHHVYFGQSLQGDAQDWRLRADIFLQQEMPCLDDA